MSETPEQQRIRLHKKRLSQVDEPLIKCLECSLSFKRVGSHVVQVHGYENAAEYRAEHGLMAKETRMQSYADEMSQKAQGYNHDNLKLGKATRFKKGGGHSEVISEFWDNHKKKSEYQKIGSNLRGNRHV